MSPAVETSGQDTPFVDLHCHSSASGGAVGEPAEIADFFSRSGCAAFSLTEHQSIASLEAAACAAQRVGIEYVPGIELSVRVEDDDAPDRVVDILGFLFEPTEELRRLAEEALERSRIWVREGLRRLRERGIVDIAEEELAATVRDDPWKNPLSVGPLARALEARGMARRDAPRSLNDQARDLLEGVFPQSQLPRRPEVGLVCEVLGRAGAVRVLAHPGGGGKPACPQQRRRLNWWLDRYVDGLEVYQRKHTPQYEALALDVVRGRNAPFSGGSDSHSYSDRAAFRRAPYACLESLRQFKAARHR